MKTYKELVEGINETLSLLEEVEGLHEDLGKHLAHAVKHLGIAQIGDVDHPEKHEKKFHDAVEKVKQSHGEQAAKDFHAHAHDDAHHLTGSGPGERGSQFHKHMSDSEKKSYTKHFNKLLGEEFDLGESRMRDLATDMESLSHADFKRKHRKTKQEMQSSLKSEELKGNQHKIDANKNGKVDGHDFKILRNAKKARYQ